MKKRERIRSHERFNRIVSVILIVVYITGLLPAQEITKALTESRNRLDYYLDKAELEYEESSWEEKAEIGLEAAMAYWESANTHLKESNNEEYEKQQQEALAYLELEKNRSYIEWLCNRTDRAATARAENELARKLKESRAGYDTKGYSLADTRKLQSAWYEESEKIINSYLEKYDEEQHNRLTEIKQRLLEKGINGEEAEGIYRQITQSSGEILKAENRLLSKSEGSRLIVRFLEDKESIKAEKSAEAAKVIAKELADNAQTESEAAMEALFTNLDKTLKGERTEEDVTGLLENFKSVFNKGLAVWEEAETEFLKSRQEWEKEAAHTYQESEQKWAEAYAELRQKRIEWEESINERIKKTQKEIEQKNTDYEKTIIEMYDIYNAALTGEKTRMLQIAESQVNLYNSLRSALVMAKEGIESWYGVWSTNYNGLYSYWKTEDNITSENGISYDFDVETFTKEKAINLKKELAAKVNSWLPKSTTIFGSYIFPTNYALGRLILDNRSSFSDLDNPLKSDLSNLDLLTELAERSQSGSELIKKLKALKTCNEWIDQILYYKDQIKNTLTDIYNFTGNRKNISFKSELETEISEAEKLVQYWEEELYVAKQVEEYAKTTDAGRDSAAKTKRDKAEAEKAYDDAFNTYTAESGKLEGLNNTILQRAAELNTINEQLSAKRGEIEKLTKEYEALLAIDQGVNIKTVTQEIKKSIDDYEKVLEQLQDAEKEMSFTEYSNSVLQEYAELISTQNRYIEAQESTVSYLSAVRDVINTETNGYYMTINLLLAELSASYGQNDNVVTDIRNKASELDEILSKSGYSSEYKAYCTEHYVNILKADFDYLITCEEIKLNGARGKEKNTYSPIAYSDDLTSYIEDVISILKIKEDSNKDLIRTIENALTDSENTITILSADDKLKLLLSKNYIFEDIELQRAYNLLTADKKNTKDLRDKIINNDTALDEEGRLYNAEYRKNIYENTRREIAAAFNNDIKAENGYDSVINYICDLYTKTDEEIKTTKTAEAALTNYVNTYLYSEAFRYRISSSYDQEAVKAAVENLTAVINETDANALNAEEAEIYRKNYWTLAFLKYTVSHSGEIDNWCEKIKNTQFCASDYLSSDDKTKYAETVNNWKTTRQAELEANVENEGKFFNEEFNSIENAKNITIDYTSYNQNLETLSKLEASLSEYAEIYTKYTLSKNQIKQQAQEKKDEIASKEFEYQTMQDGYETAVANLKNAGNAYNAQIENVNDKYREVLDARKKLRAADAVYDWAESIYLENIGDTASSDYITPKEKLSSVEYSYNRAKLSLDILKELRSKKTKEADSALTEDFKKKDKLYYDAYVLSYEVAEKVQEAFAQLEYAEKKVEIEKMAVIDTVKENSSARGVTTVVTADENNNISVSYILDINAETKASDDYYSKEYKNEKGKTVTLGIIPRTACEIEAEQWFENMQSRPSDFAKVIAAAVYYEYFVVGNKGFLENDSDADVFAVLADGVNLSDFSVQGYSKAHGNNVGSHFKDYVTDYLRNSYNSVSSADIARCILFRNVTGVYSSNIEKLETYAVKKYAYGKLENWIDDIESDHWFSSWFVWGLFRWLDAEGIWAEEVSDAMRSAKNGASSLYDTCYGNLETSVKNIISSKETMERAKKNFYMISTGSEKPSEGNIKGSQLKETIRTILSDEVKAKIDTDIILSRIDDDAEYKDVVEAMKAAVTAFQNEALAAKDLMENEQDTLFRNQENYSKLYEAEVNKGISISEADEKKLRELAVMASDLTLTITERNAASESYDRLYNSLTVTADSDYLKTLANKAWGENTFDSSKHAESLSSLFEGYISGSAKIFTNENRATEIYESEMMNNWYVNYSEVLENRLKSKLEEYKTELLYSKKSFVTQNNDVLNQLYDIQNASRVEWGKAEEKLNAAYNTWKRDFLKAYQKNTEEWKSNYDAFLEDKQEWITTMYVEAANQTAYTEEKTAEVATKSLERARNITLEKMNGVSFDSGEYVNELLGSTNLANLESHMAEVTTRLDKITGLSAMKASNAADSFASLLISQNISSEITSKMEETASKIAAAHAVENLENNIRQSYEKVDSYNQYYEDYVKELVLGAGYTWTKNGSTRTVAVDSSLAGTEHETQHVNSFQWFKTALPEVTVSTALLGNLTGESLTLAMAQDTSDLEQWEASIFGSGEGDSRQKGELDNWVGDGGRLIDDVDPSDSLKANTKDEGTGQMGPIMLNFAWNEVQKSKGIAELAKPAWDKKLWSGDFLGFEPPSIRTVACVAAAAAAAVVSIVATPVTGGTSAVAGSVAVSAAIGAAAVGAAITFTNECLFAMLDLAGDYKTPEEIGKQLATSAATSAISMFGAGAGAAVAGVSGVSGVLARTSVSAASSVTSTVTVNAIQSGGDWDRFSDSMKSFDTWKGCIASTAGSLVTNSLGAINSFDGNGIALSGKVFDSSSIGRLNSLAGGLTSTAVTFGLTGEATFNVLNISDFGAGASSGLLEVTIGGKKGFSSRLGTGGTDISRNNLLGAVKGLNEASRVTDWKYGTTEQRSTLNAINMLGYTDIKTKNNDNIQFAKDIWNEKLGVEYGDTGKDYGNYKVGDDKITLSNKLLGGGKEGSAKLAAVMSHEGTHAYGNRVEGVAHLAAAETYSQINTAFGLEGDASFGKEMLAGILDRENWKENEGDVDHWTQVIKKGKLGWQEDGDLGFTFLDGKHLSPEEMKEFIEKTKEDYKKEMYSKEALFFACEYSDSYTFNDTILEYQKFIINSEGFANASVGAVKAYTLSDEYEKAKKTGTVSWKDANDFEKNINSSMDLMFSGLYGAQASGLLIKNDPLGIAANNLIGSGSSIDPFFSLVPYSNGTINITGKDGYRIVDLEMYEKLNEGKSVPTYQLYEFSPVYHNGVDGTGSGGIVANENGSYTLKYDNTYGFNTDFYGADRSYQVAHEAGRDTILNFLNQYASSGTYLTQNNGTYKLNGVIAGTLIGTMGSTGIATGAHAHMTVNGSGKEFEELFYNSSYPSFDYLSEHTVKDAYATYMTGYKCPNFYNNDNIWNNLEIYSQESQYLNYQKILEQHYLEYEYYNYLHNTKNRFSILGN